MGCFQSKPTKSQHAHKEPCQVSSSAKVPAIGSQPSTCLHDLGMQNPTNIKQKGKKNNDKLKSFSSFLTAVRNEVKANRHIYDQFLEAEDILSILNVISSQYVHQSTATEIISIILNFLSYCKNEVGCSPVLDTIFTKKFPEELADKWLKIKQETFNFNKSQLKILSYLVESPKSGRRIFDGCFQKLKFDLSQGEVQQIAENAFKMAKEDTRSFSFLSTYFVKSCIALQKKGVSLKEIKNKYKSILDWLSENYKPAPKIEADEKLLKYHKSILHSELIPPLFVSLKGQSNRQQTLENFIMDRAEESISHLERFAQMMKQICGRNGGFQFKAGVKIQERKQHKALLRIKEKMLAKYYLEKLEQKMEQSKFESSLSIQQSFVQEKAAYEQEMQKIFQSHDEPIKFEVRDMLRGKCLFTGLDNINNCCSDILKSLQEKGNEDLKLFEIDNRLQKDTSDLVVKVLFGNVISELQLVINLNVAEYAFNHKIYELKRSKFFTPLTQLSILNEDLSNEYFGEVKQVIEANSRKKKQNDYKTVVCFEEISQIFQEFVENLPMKLNVNQEISQMNLKFMEKEVKMFQNIQMSKEDSKVKTRNEATVKLEKGKYCFEMKEIERAEKYLKEAEKCLEREKQNENEKEVEVEIEIEILFTKGNVMKDKGKYEIALNNYGKSLQIQEKMKGEGSIDTAKTLNKIGIVYSQQGNYPLALECFQKYMQIQEKVKGKGSIDIVQTLNNSGLVYQKQGKYPLALEYYKKCLQIQEKVKGKDSIDIAKTLSNIGIVFKSQGNYSLALEYYQKCLQIFQKVKGKGSFDSILTLENIGNVYNLQGNYPLTLEYYKKCLQIKEKVLGKGSIESAITLRNIGTVYAGQGYYPLALEYFQKCLQIQEKILGKGSIDTANTINSIGVVYKHQGKYPLALQYYQKCLQIEEKVKGKGSIDTAKTLNNIGTIYNQQGNYLLALEYYQKCLQIQEKVKGKGTIDTASTLMNIGQVYQNEGNYPLALEYYQKCLQIQQKVKGKGTIDTASTLNNIGTVYDHQGNYPLALEYYKKCLQIEEKVKGKGNIDTASTLNNIGNVYRSHGNYPLALEYYQKCLQIQEKVKGKGSIDTASTLSNIGIVYKSQGNYPLAYDYYSQSLSIFDNFNHVSSSKTVAKNLRLCLLQMSRSREADELSAKYNL